MIIQYSLKPLSKAAASLLLLSLLLCVSLPVLAHPYLQFFPPERTVTTDANKPLRIVSINLCTDQLLMALVEKDRVMSVSDLGKQPRYSYVSSLTEGIPSNQGLAEEIIRYQPDLIVGGAYTSAYLLKLLRSHGYRVETFAIPDSVAEIHQLVTEFSAVVGEVERGKKILKNMDTELAKIPTIPEKDRPVAAIWFPRGTTTGKGTLKDEMVTLAGFHNLAGDLGVDEFGQLSTETLLRMQPEYLVVDDFSGDDVSMSKRILHHPYVKRFIGVDKIIEMPQTHWICGGPMLPEGVNILRQGRQKNEGANK